MAEPANSSASVSVMAMLDDLLPEPLAGVQEREDAEAEAARRRIARWRV